MSNRLETRVQKLETSCTGKDATEQFLANLKAFDDGLPAPYPNASNAPLTALLRKLDEEESKCA